MHIKITINCDWSDLLPLHSKFHVINRNYDVNTIPRRDFSNTFSNAFLFLEIPKYFENLVKLNFMIFAYPLLQWNIQEKRKHLFSEFWLSQQKNSVGTFSEGQCLPISPKTFLVLFQINFLRTSVRGVAPYFQFVCLYNIHRIRRKRL